MVVIQSSGSHSVTSLTSHHVAAERPIASEKAADSFAISSRWDSVQIKVRSQHLRLQLRGKAVDMYRAARVGKGLRCYSRGHRLEHL